MTTIKNRSCVHIRQTEADTTKKFGRAGRYERITRRAESLKILGKESVRVKKAEKTQVKKTEKKGEFHDRM